jgi:hypothetical protein
VKAGASAAEKNANAAENNKPANKARPKVGNLIPSTNTKIKTRIKTATVKTTAARHPTAQATMSAEAFN